MKFLQKVKGCTGFGKHRNKDIRRDLQIFSLYSKIPEYRHKWFQHVQRMDDDRLPKRQQRTDLVEREARDVR
jgi:hypothetical protein